MYATPGVSADGVKCRNSKALDHWPLAQVDCLRPTGLQARTTSNVVPALRTAETPLKYGSSDRFSMHTWKVTTSLTSMAAGFTPGHDWSRHAVIDVLVDAWQSWADVYEESSMASWAQRLSRVIVGTLVAPKGSLFCGARRVGRVSERPPRHANARPGLRSRWQAIGALSGRHGRRTLIACVEMPAMRRCRGLNCFDVSSLQSVTLAVTFGVELDWGGVSELTSQGGSPS